ncbi:MAG: peptidyl-prolyl cis-trans isomerase [Candidatus Sumerlaeaceae bacterium]|nr:peptidyl-prolyl cis-trans isomerase [Candidatus Sumerlaeaceae bacterium]
MLRQLRSPKLKTILFIGLCFIIIPSFAVFYGWNSGQGSQRAMGQGEAAATIKLPSGKSEVHQEDLRRARNYLRSEYASYAGVTGKKMDRSTADGLSDSAAVMDYAINLKILEDFARQQGIVVSEDEVLRNIQKRVPANMRQQALSQLERQGMTLDQLTATQQYDLFINRIREVLASRVRVSNYEAWLYYNSKNEKLTAEKAEFPNSDFLQKVEVSDADLQKYFDQNKEKFRVPDKVEYAYILVNKDDLKNKLTASDDEITSYHTTHGAEFEQPRAARISQILIKKPIRGTVAEDRIASETEIAKSRAEDIYQQLVKGADFAVTANRVNEETFFPPREEDQTTTAGDAATTGGGNLGFLSEVTAASFYGDEYTSVVFNMAPGSLSAPIDTDRGFIIVKLNAMRDKYVQPLAKVIDRVRDRVLAEKVEPVFELTKARLAADAQKYTSIEKLAEVTSEPLKVTPKIDKKSKFIPGIGPVGDFEISIGDLQKGGRSEVLTDANRHLIIEIKEEYPEHLPTLDEARETVTAAYKESRAREMARAAAEALKTKATNLETLKTAAAEAGTSLSVTQPFTRGEEAMQLGAIAKFSEIAGTLTTGSIVLSAIGDEKEPSGYVVWGVTAKDGPSKEDFARALPEIVNEMAARKVQTLLNEYLRDRRKELSSSIDINPLYR